MQGLMDPPRPQITFDFKRDFNATGDGVTDDSAAWALALNRAQGGETGCRHDRERWMHTNKLHSRLFNVPILKTELNYIPMLLM